MTLTEVELATLQIALTALENDPDAKLPTTTINAIIGAEWAAEIVNRRKSENGGAIFDHGSGGIVLLRAA